MKNRSTLEDVASAAGVSVSTVSSVLAGNANNRRISEVTRARVSSAAQSLAYSPNLLQRSIRRGRTNIISLFNAFRRRDRDDLYLDRLLGAIEEAGGDLGYNVLVHTNYRQSLEETFQFLNGGFSDGLVLFGSADDEPLIPLLKEAGLPTVLVAPRSQVNPPFTRILDDERMGMQLVADALIELGHRQIAVVVYQEGSQLDPTGRLNLLKQALSRHQLEIRDENVLIYGSDPQGTARQFLSLSPRPTALFVWHDGNAYKILEALEAEGASVPDDLSIIGYDGINWPSKSKHTIASVEVPMNEMALAGVQELDRLISEASPARTLTVPVRFNPGSTLGPPNLNP